jgi:hypothetical protein
MGLSAFLKENTVKKDNLKVIVSDRFREKDEEGNDVPAKWEIKAITSEEEASIKEQCTKMERVGKGMTMPRTDFEKYNAKLAAACTVYPNLNSEELQESYGVMGEEKLLRAMLLPGEYSYYLNKVQEFNGFDYDMDEMVEEAKN